ncbi:MAG: NnrS family protein [Arcobacter sp.]|nr:NnrS family protein [Arcobacter sp.]
MNEEKKYATNHYSHYPDGEYPIYLAYGFRPIFLLLAPFIVLSIILWTFSFGGFINLSFIKEPLTWHIYEMLYGIGSAGIIAFFLTGVPEMFPGAVPIVGRKLLFVVVLWVLSRLSFWFMGYVSVYVVAFLNIFLSAYIIALIIKPVFADIRKKHISLAFTLLALLFIQIFFFINEAKYTDFSSTSILYLSLGAFIVLILLALRRVNMEAVNEFLEQEDIEETFYSRAFRYNLAIFCVILYTAVEFLFPQNSVLAYLAFACGAAILGILNDFILKDYNILFKAFIIYLMCIVVLTALGYFFLGYDYINDDIYALNHFRHFLTTGTFGLVFFVIMIIVSTVHTGRKIFTNIWLHFGVFCIIMATFIRALIPFYEAYMIEAYLISSIIWAIPFIIYMKIFFPFLLSKRVDGIKG